ncbi:hypothetical protein [Micromonospora sp. 4G55]|uniref:hypothetical protein n=1 Tax=Micromonospora sp. 4G55 TaxID=2806102 RepID=UPI001A5965CD|nr:hypothetical protein [Micromonospora sp. 4G55]MBM0255899.1 hypothetical protein [Micromonospora sp. 4G55]
MSPPTPTTLALIEFKLLVRYVKADVPDVTPAPAVVPRRSVNFHLLSTLTSRR